MQPADVFCRLILLGFVVVGWALVVGEAAFSKEPLTLMAGLAGVSRFPVLVVFPPTGLR